jgi:hypothetical protein
LVDRRIVFYYRYAKVYPENLLSFNDRPKRMSQPSKFITYSIGGLSLFAGVLFIALAPLMSRFGIGFEGDPKFSSRGIGFSILLASAGFWMAMKGRWIGSS